MSSENAKPRATALPRLDWQGELDSAMTDIDTRLTHPRRRSAERERQPKLPELGQPRGAAEIADEFTWTDAEQMFRDAEATPAQARSESPASIPEYAPPDAVPERSALGPGKILRIRYKWPQLPWPLRLLQRGRKRQVRRTTGRLRA